MELQLLLLFLWLGSGPVQSSVIRRYYWYESTPRTWEEAQQFCRRDGRDLATVVTHADLWVMNLRFFHAWFGLKEMNGIWLWIDGNYPTSRKKRSFSSSSSSSEENLSGSTGGLNMDVFPPSEPQDEKGNFSVGRDLVNYGDLREMNLKLLQAWFGLKKKDSSVWQWPDENDRASRKKRSSSTSTSSSSESTGGSGTNIINIMDVFAPDEPQDGELCGNVKYRNGKAFGEDCDQKHFVFCEDTSGAYLISETMTWAEGHQRCHSQNRWYMDFTGVTNFHFQGSPVRQVQDFPVWIGLRRNGDDWSGSDGTHSEYRNWTSDPSPSPGSESCVAVSSKYKTMLNKSCSDAFPFLCYKHNVVLLREKLSWEDALDTCRNMRDAYNYSSFRLLSVEESELQYALSHAQGATTDKVWVGLRFLAGFWFWSDGTPVSLSFLPSCPDLSLGCGALVLNRSSETRPLLEPTDCSEKLNLLCYGSGPLWQQG